MAESPSKAQFNSKRDRILNHPLHGLLLAQLEDPSKNDFTAFLEEFQLSENIAFLQEVQKFSQQFSQLQAQMSSIWNRFISADAAQPINIDAKTEKHITSLVFGTHLQGDMFVAAEEHIKYLLLSEAMPNFNHWLLQRGQITPVELASLEGELLQACSQGNLEAVRELMRHPHIGRFIDSHAGDVSPLLNAIQSPLFSVDLLVCLLQPRLIDVNRRLADQSTPLHVLARGNNVEAIVLLLAANGDPSLRNANVELPVDCADCVGKTAFAQFETKSLDELSLIYDSVRQFREFVPITANSHLSFSGPSRVASALSTSQRASLISATGLDIFPDRSSSGATTDEVSSSEYESGDSRSSTTTTQELESSSTAHSNSNSALAPLATKLERTKKSGSTGRFQITTASQSLSGTNTPLTRSDEAPTGLAAHNQANTGSNAFGPPWNSGLTGSGDEVTIQRVAPLAYLTSPKPTTIFTSSGEMNEGIFKEDFSFLYYSPKTSQSMPVQAEVRHSQEVSLNFKSLTSTGLPNSSPSPAAHSDQFGADKFGALNLNQPVADEDDGFGFLNVAPSDILALNESKSPLNLSPKFSGSSASRSLASAMNLAAACNEDEQDLDDGFSFLQIAPISVPPQRGSPPNSSPHRQQQDFLNSTAHGDKMSLGSEATHTGTSTTMTTDRTTVEMATTTEDDGISFLSAPNAMNNIPTKSCAMPNQFLTVADDNATFLNSDSTGLDVSTSTIASEKIQSLAGCDVANEPRVHQVSNNEGDTRIESRLESSVVQFNGSS